MDNRRNDTEQSGWFYCRFLMFPILGISLYPAFIMGAGGEHWTVRTIWVLFLGYCWFCAAGLFHEMTHRNLFRSEAWNVWVGRITGTLISLPYTMYQESHRRHHAYLNSPDDPEMWPYCDPNYSLTFRRRFLFFDIFAAILTIPYTMGRIYFRKDSPLKEAVRKTIFREYLALILFWGIFMIIARLNGYRIWHFDPVWILPFVFSQMFNTFRKLIEHLGMTSNDPVMGTRTILPGNPITRLLIYFNFDEAIHGPHHRFPKLKYFQLVNQAEKIRSDNPDQPVPIFGSLFWAAWDMFPHLWNPRTGDPNAKSRFTKGSTAIEASMKESDWEFAGEDN